MKKGLSIRHNWLIDYRIKRATSSITLTNKDLEKIREPNNIFVSGFVKNADELSVYEDAMQQEMSKWKRVSQSLNEKYQSALASYVLNYVALSAVQVVGAGVKAGTIRDVPSAVRDYFNKEFPKHIDGLHNQNKQMSAEIVGSGIGGLEKDVITVLNSLSKKSSLNLSIRHIIKEAEIPKIELSETENKIFDLLKDVIQANNLGSTIRVAGGWLRDRIMGNQSKDIDIVVDNMSGKEFANHVVKHAQSKDLPVKSVGVIEARPEQSKHLETAVVNLFGQDIDFVQARAERYDPGSRIPKVVPGSAVEDAYRRDFTINAMFYNINSGEVEDPTGMGLSDLESGIIRTPSPPQKLWPQLGIEGEENAITPKKTFMDDPLRVLRAIRFASRYGFDLAPELQSAAKDEEVQDAFSKKISRERMEIELRKMLTGKDPVGAMELIKELGLRSEVLRLPEGYEEWEMDQQSPYHQLSVWEHTMETLNNLQEIIKDRNLGDKEKFVVNLAALLHDAGKLDPEIKGVKEVGGKMHHTYHGHEDVSMNVAEHLLRNLPGVRVEEIEKVKNLIDGARMVNPQRQLSDETCNMSRKALGKFIQKIGDDWESAVDLAMADTSAHKKDWLPTFNPTYYKTMKEQVGGMGLEKAHELRPILSGNEIMELMGRKGGPWLGQLNQALVDWQLETPEATKEQAKGKVLELYKGMGLDKVSVISIRNIKKPISKRAEEFYDIGAKKLITANDLIKLYELEYKLSQLYRRDLSKPSSIKKVSVMENQLFKLLSKAINAMAEIYRWWIELHKHDLAVASMEQMEEEINSQYPEKADILLDQLIDWYSGYRTRYDDIFTNISNNIKRKAFEGGIFGGIVDTYKKLQAGASGNINNDMVLFHTALNTVHQAGPMLTHLVGSTDITEELLNDLSAGKFVPQWDAEISKLSSYISISKRAKKKQHAGIFMPLPEKLAKQFPSLGKYDGSVPHVTVLYIGDVDKKHYKILETIARGVISNFPPFKSDLDEKVTYFNTSDEYKVAKLKVISKEIHKLNKQLRQMISDAGIEVDNTHPNYKPHITLEYMEPPKKKYDGDIPQGSWISHSVEIWGCGSPKEILFDKRLSKK